MCTVLVVDDDELVGDSTAAMLSSLRHDVVQAKDGSEAFWVYKIMLAGAFPLSVRRVSCVK